LLHANSIAFPKDSQETTIAAKEGSKSLDHRFFPVLTRSGEIVWFVGVKGGGKCRGLLSKVFAPLHPNQIFCDEHFHYSFCFSRLENIRPFFCSYISIVEKTNVVLVIQPSSPNKRKSLQSL